MNNFSLIGWLLVLGFVATVHSQGSILGQLQANFDSPGDEFQCQSGLVIKGSWKCDRVEDCDDGSDEWGCDYGANNLFQCADGRQFIKAWWQCDKVKDCTDGSDEADCGCTTCPDLNIGNATQNCIDLNSNVRRCEISCVSGFRYPSGLPTAFQYCVNENGNCVWKGPQLEQCEVDMSVWAAAARSFRSPDSSCVDKASNCESLRDWCGSTMPAVLHFMNTKCQRTCNKCEAANLVVDSMAVPEN